MKHSLEGEGGSLSAGRRPRLGPVGVCRQWGPAVLLTLGLAVVAVVSAAMPRQGHTLAVIMPPWQGFPQAARAVAHGGGAIKSVGAWDWIVATDLSGARDVAMLYQQGAWLVVDASAAKGCLGL